MSPRLSAALLCTTALGLASGCAAEEIITPVTRVDSTGDSGGAGDTSPGDPSPGDAPPVGDGPTGDAGGGDTGPECGNGVPEAGEGCDDDNTNWCDGCAGDCSVVETLSTWYVDADGDGFGDLNDAGTQAYCAPGGAPARVGNNSDCHDDRNEANPNAEEICGNGFDDDCAGGDVADCGGDIVTLTFNDGTGLDSSGNGHDGIPRTGCGADLPMAASGVFGNGMSFPGTCAHVGIADSAALFTGNTITIEVWVFRTQSWGDQVIYGDHIWNHTPSGEYTLQVAGTDAAEPTGTRFKTNDGTVDGNEVSRLSTASEIQLNQWTYVAVTWNGSQVSFYLDGVNTETIDLAFNPVEKTVTGDHYVGALGGSQSFVGVLDELRVTSYVKTVEEIRATMRHDSTTGGL